MIRRSGAAGARPAPGSERGQILVLFAAAFAVMAVMAALAVEVSSAYALQRLERSVADAAALAGAQDLQPQGSRSSPTSTERTRARSQALRRAAVMLNGQVNLGSAACDPSRDQNACPITGTPYVVSVHTPSPSAVRVRATRAIQVTVRQPDFRVPFAGIATRGVWNIAVTSVAGIGYARQYAFVTLRPPDPSSNRTTDNNEANIFVEGGSVVDVVGDVVTNTNLILGNNAAFTLDEGSAVYYHDAYRGWTGNPPGEYDPDLTPDPDYPIPAAFGTVDPDPLTAVRCQQEIDKATANGYVGQGQNAPYPLTVDVTTCLVPGRYTSDPGQNINNSRALLFTPGVYFLQGGLTMNGTMIGGYEAGSSATGAPRTGVALVFEEVNRTSAGAFKGNSATLIALNAGECVTVADPRACTRYASPARAGSTSLEARFESPDGLVVVPLTMIVRRDPNCVVQPVNATTCDRAEGHNASLNIAGGGNLRLFGVQYAPTDNVEIRGGASGDGFAGQIVAWTVAYTGGTHVSLSYPGRIRNGVLSLDAACSGLGTTCVIP